MSLKSNHSFSVITGILLLISFNSFCKEHLTSFSKANTVQIVSYKPPKAKAGKNGSERIVILQIGKGPKAGKNGKTGKTGPNLKAVIYLMQSGDTNMLRMIVTEISNNNKLDTFYVNPRFGQIKLIADGGDGGFGGQGEAGGGTSGNGGKGGAGGQIEVIFDSSALAYASCQCLVFSNEGGKGGWSGENYGTAGESGVKGLPIYLKAANGKVLSTR